MSSNVQLLDDISRNMVDNDIIVPDDEVRIVFFFFSNYLNNYSFLLYKILIFFFQLHITISGIDQFANEEIVSIEN